MRPKITVVTITNRWGGVDIWRHNLQKQTFTDFEAVLIDENYGLRKEEVEDYITNDGRFSHTRALPKDPHRFYNLSKCMNQGVAIATGELIVFYQDYIWLPDDTLQKFWDRYQEIGPALISGVGHKAKFPEWAINLEGMISIFTRTGLDEKRGDEDKPELSRQKPEGVWFRDPRVQGRGFHPCNPIEWECDVAALPAKIAYDLGGFDEDFDAGRCYDNVNFAERAVLAGYQCWLDETNEHLGYCHERLFELSEKSFLKKAPNNLKLWERKCEGLQRGEFPIRLGFLQKTALAAGA